MWLSSSVEMSKCKQQNNCTMTERLLDIFICTLVLMVYLISNRTMNVRAIIINNVFNCALWNNKSYGWEVRWILTNFSFKLHVSMRKCYFQKRNFNIQVSMANVADATSFSIDFHLQILHVHDDILYTYWKQTNFE